MKQKSLKNSILSVVLGIIILFLALSITLLYLNTDSSIINTFQKYGEKNAERIASKIDVDKYEAFLKNPTEDATYHELSKQLNSIRKNSGYLYVYTLAVVDEQLSIMIDGNDIPVPIGSQVTGAEYEHVKSVVQEGKPHSSGLITDKSFGSYLSSFAPIKNNNGEVVGILGIDIEASIVNDVDNSIMKKMLPIVITITVLFSVIILFCMYLYLNKKMKPLSHLMKVTQSITNGDISEAKQLINEKDIKDRNEIGALYVSTKAMTNTIEQLIGNMTEISQTLNEKSTFLKGASQEVSEGAQQVSRTMEEMASASESQANLASTLNDAMVEYTGLYEQTSIQGNAIADATQQTLNEAHTGTQLMNDSREKMDQIYSMIQDSVAQIMVVNNENQEVSALVGFIKAIADQTHLLSLNASIEAARAGEHGRGFAVVASEVGKLSHKVSSSVNGIDTIVKDIISNSNKMVEMMEAGLQKVSDGRENLLQTGETFNAISMSLESMNELASDMRDQLRLVKKKETEIKASIVEVAAISQENAASIEEVAASSEEITASMESLSQLVTNLNDASEQMKQISDLFNIE
ncbi:methyl-accepting chemotaxis protein [Paenibacillus marinisediminis]